MALRDLDYLIISVPWKFLILTDFGVINLFILFLSNLYFRTLYEIK